MTEAADGPLLESSVLPRRFVSIEAAAVAGIVCAVGWSLSLRGLLTAPGVGAPDAEIVEYYSDPYDGTAAVVWLQVLVFSTIAFLWFVGVVRSRLGDQEPKLFGTVFLGSSIMLAGLVFVGAALLGAPSVLVAVGDKRPGPDVVSLSRAGAAVVYSVFAPRIATLLMFSTANLGRATGALPRWLIWLTYGIGVAGFVDVTVGTPTIYLTPAWIALISVVLLIRRTPSDFELGGPTPVPVDGR